MIMNNRIPKLFFVLLLPAELRNVINPSWNSVTASSPLIGSDRPDNDEKWKMKNEK